MSTSPRPALRWSVPVTVAALAVGGAVLGPVLSAAAEVELPARTPEQLLTDLATADVDAFSGTVAQRAELGLPELPDGVGGEYSTDALSLLTGEHDLRVWVDGHRSRVSLHGTMGESGVVADGSDVWVWSSDDRSVTRFALPDDAAHAERAEALAEALPPVTPDAVARLVLDRLDGSTDVRAGTSTRVAGRPAYVLVLEPRDDATLVGTIRIAVDAERRVPTRVQVVADGATTPALEVGFTSLSFDRPDEAVFRFAPPAGATVEHVVVPEHDHAGPTPEAVPGGPGAGSDAATGPRRGAVVGEGWGAVAVGRVPDALGEADGDLGAFLQTLPTVGGTWGTGRLMSSSLFTALLTDDGRLLVGAVGPDALLAAAGDPAADLG